jgi:small GTP-binding protein
LSFSPFETTFPAHRILIILSPLYFNPLSPTPSPATTNLPLPQLSESAIPRISLNFSPFETTFPAHRILIILSPLYFNRLSPTPSPSTTNLPLPQLFECPTPSMSGSAVPTRRVVIVGDSSVGKTSLVSVAMGEVFNALQTNTVGADWHVYTTFVSGEQFEFQIWDTAGQERYRTIGPLYYRNALAAIAVYDISSRETFVDLYRWIDAVIAVAGPSTLMFVVGNKADVDDNQGQRKVTFDEGEEWAKAPERNYLFFETSAKTGQGVTLLFQTVAEMLAVQAQHQPEEAKLAPRSKGCC